MRVGLNLAELHTFVHDFILDQYSIVTLKPSFLSVVVSLLLIGWQLVFCFYIYLAEECFRQPVFGVSLEEHLRHTRQPIASVLNECITALKSEGLELEVCVQLLALA